MLLEDPSNNTPSYAVIVERKNSPHFTSMETMVKNLYLTFCRHTSIEKICGRTDKQIDRHETIMVPFQPFAL